MHLLYFLLCSIYLQGKLKTNWSDHFVAVENVLDTDSVMSLQTLRGRRSRRRSVGLCYGIKHCHMNLGSVCVGVAVGETEELQQGNIVIVKTAAEVQVH